MYGNSDINQDMTQVPEEPIELTPEQKTTVRGSMKDIREKTEKLLPFDYAVETDVDQTPSGSSYSVAVWPPVGRGVSIAISVQDLAEETPDGPEVQMDELDFDAERCEEIAQHLVASTILQVRQTDDDGDSLPAS